MPTNRRNWLKQAGLAFAGIGLAPLKEFALPTPSSPEEKTGNKEIRLCYNENPYGPSASAKAAMAAQVNLSNRYNWDISGELVKAIAAKENLSTDNILLGAGSTEMLNLVVHYTAFQKGSFVIPAPSFTGWSASAERMGLEKITVPLTPDKRIDLPSMLKAIRPDTKMVYICNPNNPTGTVCKPDELTNFIKEASKHALVMLDEAYIHYSGQTSLSSLVSANRNLVVVKTFSKIYGMAGARVGYAVAHADTIDQLANLQSWPNGSISVVSGAGALASVKDNDFVKQAYSLNEKARQYTIEEMERLHIFCIPSSTNFIYFSLEDYKEDFFARLKSNNIKGTGIHEEKGHWSRITVGTMEEMKLFIGALQ